MTLLTDRTLRTLTARLSLALTPVHWNVVSSLAKVSAFIVIAKGASTLREITIAGRYGTGPAVDAYVYVFNLFLWPITVWAGALGIILVPLLIRETRERPAELEKFEREFFSLSAAVGLALGAIAALVLTAIFLTSSSGLPPTTASYARWMAVALAVVIPLGYASTLFASQLMATRRHTNSLFEGIPALCLVLAVIVSRDQSGRSLVIGTVAGYLVQLAALILSEPRFRKAISPLPRFSSALWKELGRYGAVVVLAQLLIGASSVADQVMAAHIGANSNAILGYATRTITLFTGVGAIAIARALLPVLSELRFSGDGTEGRIAKHWSVVLFCIGAAIATAGWIGAQPLVRIAFERGAFTARDTEQVATILRFGFLQLPFYFSSIVIAQLVASRALYRIFLYSNGTALAVKIFFNIILMPIMGVSGATLATAIMYATSCVSLWWFVHRVRSGNTIGTHLE